MVRVPTYQSSPNAGGPVVYFEAADGARALSCVTSCKASGRDIAANLLNSLTRDERHAGLIFDCCDKRTAKAWGLL